MSKQNPDSKPPNTVSDSEDSAKRSGTVLFSAEHKADSAAGLSTRRSVRTTGSSSRQQSPTSSTVQLPQHQEYFPMNPSQLPKTKAAFQIPQTSTADTSANSSPKLYPNRTKSPPPPIEHDGTFHILLAVTGSVATIKIPLIVEKLQSVYGDKAQIQLMVTTSAEYFLRGMELPQDVKIWRDDDEWESRHSGETYVHVKLRRWADILVIAPMSANTLAKVANGICDNLLTSVVRAWNPASPIIACPAMNSWMYTNPVTGKHLELIAQECPWFDILEPISKELICGDVGPGAMIEWSDVVDAIVAKLGTSAEATGTI